MPGSRVNAKHCRSAAKGGRAYRETRYTYGAPSTKYRFTGQREESTIGLYFYNARWYDAALGRFIEPDSIVPQPDNPQSLNRYSYADNNPLRYSDPSGHYTFEEEPEESSHFWEARVRSKYRWTHPQYHEGTTSDTEILAALTSPIWGAAGTVAAIGAVELAGPVATTKAFLTRAGVGGTAGVAGDYLGQLAEGKDYDASRIPGVFTANALGAAVLGEASPLLGESAGRVAAAGLTNAAAGSAQRQWVGERVSAETVADDLFTGVASGVLGEVITTGLTKHAKWSAATVEYVSSFVTNDNLQSALRQGFTQMIRSFFEPPE